MLNIEINVQQTFRYLLISSFTSPRSIVPNVSTRRSGENQTNICIHQPRKHHYGRDGCPNLGVQEKVPKLLCRMSEKRNLEKIKQISVYINQEKITMEEMGGITDGFKRVLPNLLDQMLHYNQIEAVKLPAFLVSQIPSILCKMSQKGDLDKIKQIFSYVNQENISTEEMGVKTNEVNQPKKPTLVDTNTGYRGRSPLIEAAISGHHQVCKYLITEQNANLEVRDDYQMTALIWAACSNKCEVIKLLLKNNANYKAKSKAGHHAAYHAAWYGSLEALKMLVEEDGGVIDLKGRNGETALIAASICGRVDVCKYLVEEKNANVNLKDNQGRSALEHLQHHNIIKIMKKQNKETKLLNGLNTRKREKIVQNCIIF